MQTSSVIGLMGPTASGKTAFALELAEHYPIEIISVDSALIYRDMDIGTAKPTKAEQAQVPHHLIDIIDPTRRYSAGQFVKETAALVKAIQARGKIPLLIGGTMLYFKALQQGISNMPEQAPTIRAQIDLDAKTQGWPELHQKLKEIDPLIAAKIKPTDSQRIQRALEVFMLSGKPLSAFHESNETVAVLPDLVLFGLFPSDRTYLHERIANRIHLMMKQGFIEEVEALRQKYLLSLDLPSMRAVGYRQIWNYLEGSLPRTNLDDQILFATRQYAKRQLTWMKAWPKLNVFDLNELTQLKKQFKAILS